MSEKESSDDPQRCPDEFGGAETWRITVSFSLLRWCVSLLLLEPTGNPTSLHIFSNTKHLCVINMIVMILAEEKDRLPIKKLASRHGRQFSIYYSVPWGEGFLGKIRFSWGGFGQVCFYAASSDSCFLQMTCSLLEVNDAVPCWSLSLEGCWWPAVPHFHGEMDLNCRGYFSQCHQKVSF